MREPDEHHAEIARLLDVLTAAHRKTLAALDEAEREVKETRGYFAAKRGAYPITKPENEKAG